MTVIDNNFTSIINELGLNPTQEVKKKEDFGQEEFLKLMIAQLKNQSPLEPLKNGEFLSQIAQFTAAAGMKELQASFKDLASTLQSNQALQATSLVGRTVLVESNKGYLDEGSKLDGVINLRTATGSLALNVYTTNGEFVRRLELGVQNAGDVRFSWDGINNEGKNVPPGIYKISAEAIFEDETRSVKTLIEASVESVTLRQNGQGILLNLARLGSVDMSQIRQLQ